MNKYKLAFDQLYGFSKTKTPYIDPSLIGNGGDYIDY